MVIFYCYICGYELNWQALLRQYMYIIWLTVYCYVSSFLFMYYLLFTDWQLYCIRLIHVAMMYTPARTLLTCVYIYVHVK